MWLVKKLVGEDEGVSCVSDGVTGDRGMDAGDVEGGGYGVDDG